MSRKEERGYVMDRNGRSAEIEDRRIEMRKMHQIQVLPVQLKREQQLLGPAIPPRGQFYFFYSVVWSFETVEFFRKKEYDVIILFIEFKDTADEVPDVVSDPGLREPEHPCVYTDGEFIFHR